MLLVIHPVDQPWRKSTRCSSIPSKLYALPVISFQVMSLTRMLPCPKFGLDLEIPPNLHTSERKQLAFFAGQINSPVRAALVKIWRNDTDIFAHFGRFKKPYGYQLMRSKFCLHVKVFEVNTAHISDALYYGCVPIIIADRHDLPFADILNWNSFSVVVAAVDIPVLKRVLQRISFDEYSWLQSNVLKVRKHFKWNDPPVDHDAFYITMYELWLRRSSVRVPLMRV